MERIYRKPGYPQMKREAIFTGERKTKDGKLFGSFSGIAEIRIDSGECLWMREVEAGRRGGKRK